MSNRTKETIRISVEVEIEYTEGFRDEAVAYAKRQCFMRASCYLTGGTIDVKTSGKVDEIKRA